MWYTKPDNTDVVEGNPMKEKTYQTRCGTIHYWVSVSNPYQSYPTNPIYGFLSTSCLESYAPYWHKALRNIHCLAS